MQHASIKHVLLHDARQVSFDLEGGYARSFPILEALAHELASNLRSLLKLAAGTDLELLGASFMKGYGSPVQIRTIADFGLRSRGISRAVRRSSDRRRREEFSKYDMLCWVEEKLGT